MLFFIIILSAGLLHIEDLYFITTVPADSH